MFSYQIGNNWFSLPPLPVFGPPISSPAQLRDLFLSNWPGVGLPDLRDFLFKLGEQIFKFLAIPVEAAAHILKNVWNKTAEETGKILPQGPQRPG